jgi:hypothetical protein
VLLAASQLYSYSATLIAGTVTLVDYPVQLRTLRQAYSRAHIQPMDAPPADTVVSGPGMSDDPASSLESFSCALCGKSFDRSE